MIRRSGSARPTNFVHHSYHPGGEGGLIQDTTQSGYKGSNVSYSSTYTESLKDLLFLKQIYLLYYHDSLSLVDATAIDECWQSTSWLLHSP